MTMQQHGEITFHAVGDVMLGDSPQCFGHGVGSRIESHGPLFPFDLVAETLREGDVVFGNLEIVLSRHDRKADRFPAIEYRAQPEAIRGLVACGFDVMNAATNHTMEHGQPALEETLDLLAENGIKSVGVDVLRKNINRYCFLEKNGIRFCFVGYNFRPQQYFIDEPSWPTPDRDLIMKDIDALRDRADCIVVSMHWGDEFITYPSPEQVELGHALIDHGANIVLGHHPHIIQGVERYKGGVIAYSLGNFVFDMWPERLRKSMILKCKISKGKDIDFEIIPVLINRSHQPEILIGEKGDRLREELSGLSEKIQYTEEKKYNLEVTKNTAQFRRDVYKYYLTNVWRYNPRYLFANFMGAMKKRL